MLPVSGRVGVGGAFRAGVCPLQPGRRQTLFLFEKHPVAGLRWQHLRVAEGWGPLGLGALLVPSLESGPGRLPTVKSATRVLYLKRPLSKVQKLHLNSHRWAKMNINTALPHGFF